MKYVIYKRPEVDDKHYDEYDWTRDGTPFDDEQEARKSMPSIGSEVGKGYVFTVVPYEDDEEIESSLSDSEKQSQIRKHR